MGYKVYLELSDVNAASALQVGAPEEPQRAALQDHNVQLVQPLFHIERF